VRLLLRRYDRCRVLLVERKIIHASEVVGVLESAIKTRYPLLIVAEGIAQEALATLVVNKLRGNLMVVALRTPGFGERKTQYLEDIATLSGASVFREALGSCLAKTDVSTLGQTARAVVGKEYCTIVGDGSQQELVRTRIEQRDNRATLRERQVGQTRCQAVQRSCRYQRWGTD